MFPRTMSLHRLGVFGIAITLSAGCARTATEQSFAVRDIESMKGRRDGSVRIKLSTPGNYAEADESALIRLAQIVAVCEATPRQRRVAEARGRAAYREMAASWASDGRKARYLAVETELSNPYAARPDPKGRKPRARAVASVMIFDTETQELVGNTVYDVSSAPEPGSVARFETFTAECVGSGL